MTKGPKCVRNEDSALDALEMMVDNRFRHLPVLDQDGGLVYMSMAMKSATGGRSNNKAQMAS